jgi:hypothetical protein
LKIIKLKLRKYVKECLCGVSWSLKDLEDEHCKIEIIDLSKVNEDNLNKYENLFYKVTSDAKLLINSYYFYII